MKFLNSASNIINQFELFLIDIWGIIYDGQNLISESIEFLDKLHQANKSIVFISNSPTPSTTLRLTLDKLGLSKYHYQMISSGDIAIHHFNQNKCEDKLFFFLGPQRHQPLKTQLLIPFTNELDKSHAIIHTGMQEEITAPNFYDIAAYALENNLHWYCLNPDVQATIGQKKIDCAGLLAQFITQKGGKVTYFGKPFNDIYQRALAFFPKVKPQDILCIGDTIHTDILGAKNQQLKSFLLTSGTHAPQLHEQPENIILARLANIGIQPDYLGFKL